MIDSLTWPDHIRETLRCGYDKFLKTYMEAGFIPVSIKIRGHRISIKEIVKNSKSFLQWRDAWHGYDNVIFEDFSKGVLGTLKLPVCLNIQTIEEYLYWSGMSQNFKRFSERLEMLESVGCDLGKLSSIREKINNLPNHDLCILCDLVEWRRSHPHERPMMRDVALPNMDTKWIEGRLGLVERTFAAANLTLNGDTPQERCGFATSSTLDVKMKFHQKDFQITECSFAPGDMRVFPKSIDTLLITENQSNFKLIKPREGLAVLWGAGRAVEVSLGLLPIPLEISLVYWGDCDSHGYSILSNLRLQYPRIQSIGMSIEDVKTFEDSTVKEPLSAQIHSFIPNLTQGENDAREYLLAGEKRLEQERVKIVLP